ncbi:uncharacterized protein ARMOST_11184 [Armillaria ostoyae]|uniref:DUF6534 domain-containing protein n=1 Tax=Armillaria ostoyae TaxID=47428 RepID=A0A284RGE9_ARMOS|nr:uncharacterized protein ARMOST_11184 [Armillaria ostoyae]
MPEKFENTFGCMFISFSLDLMCYGAGFLVVLQYFRRGYGSKDSVVIRTMVVALGFLATVHVATFIAWAYDDLISRFGAFERLDAMPRTALVQLLAIYMVSFISQCFFTTRIWIREFRDHAPNNSSIETLLVTHKWYLAGPIAILALINITAGISVYCSFITPTPVNIYPISTNDAKVLQKYYFSPYQSERVFRSGIGGTFSNLINTEKVTSLQAAATAACDLLITATLCWILNKKRTGIKTTDTLLDNLIILAINRGAVTSLAALFNLILFVWRPEAMIFMIPLLPSCQFYVLSVVGSLNSRRSLRDNGRDAVTLPLEPMSGSESSAGGSGGVQVSTSVVSWKDGSQLGSHNDTGIEKSLPSPVSV